MAAMRKWRRFGLIASDRWGFRHVSAHSRRAEGLSSSGTRASRSPVRWHDFAAMRRICTSVTHVLLRSYVAGVTRAADELVDEACSFAWAQLLRYQPDRDMAVAWLWRVAVREVWRLER